jgi:hypothetical protein
MEVTKLVADMEEEFVDSEEVAGREVVDRDEVVEREELEDREVVAAGEEVVAGSGLGLKVDGTLVAVLEIRIEITICNHYIIEIDLELYTLLERLYNSIVTSINNVTCYQYYYLKFCTGRQLRCNH